jgi:hypothetical protein
MDVAECANLLIEGHLDCFQVLKFMNKASIQTFAWTFCVDFFININFISFE